MKNKTFAAIVYLSLLSLIAGCAGNEGVIAPNIEAGSPLQDEYMVGKWCTNRELTSDANSEAGFSALLNISPEFWKLTDDKKWQRAESGWIFKTLGTWQLEGRDKLILTREQGNKLGYQARFENSGLDLYLVDDEGQFLVISRCE